MWYHLIKILLHLFEFEEVYLIISFGSDLVQELHGPLVHWSIGPPAQAGLEVIPHWVASNSNPMPHKTYLFQMNRVSHFISKHTTYYLSFLSNSNPMPHKTYLSRKYEAYILLRIHNSKNIILFCLSNKNTKCVSYISLL